MSAIAKIDGKALLGSERWLAAVAPSNWRGMAMVAHAWVVIVLSATAAIITAHPLVVTLAVLVIGSRQLGLSILMHDAAHGVLLTDRRYNDRLGQWLCAFPVGLDMHAYRTYHLKHHRFAQQSEDPDLPLSAKFPVSRASMMRKIARDLTGLTFLRIHVLPVIKTLLDGDMPSLADRALLAFNVALLLLAWWLDAVHWYLLLWLLPTMTWKMLVTRIRNIAEHACVSNDDNPWHIARTTHANWLARVFVAPYFVNYHAEHHLFMAVPCYRLPILHAALAEQGFLEMHSVPVDPNYVTVLRTASGAQA